MTDSPTSCASKLKALADPTRLAVMRALASEGARHVWELNENLQLEPSLLSKHLRVLREAGLVSSERHGKAVLYRLTEGAAVAGAGDIDLGCCSLTFPQDDS